MIQKIKTLIIVAMAFCALPLAMPIAVSAQQDTTIQGGLCHGAQDLQVTGGSSPCTEQQTNGVGDLIKKVINILSVVVGVAAVVMIIIAGFRYITSGGKQDSVTSAKNTILYAVIGLVVVALAQIIVRFVLTRATTNS